MRVEGPVPLMYPAKLRCAVCLGNRSSSPEISGFEGRQVGSEQSQPLAQYERREELSHPSIPEMHSRGISDGEAKMQASYNRKDKSLGLLCEKFLSHPTSNGSYEGSVTMEYAQSALEFRAPALRQCFQTQLHVLCHVDVPDDNSLLNSVLVLTSSSAESTPNPTGEKSHVFLHLYGNENGECISLDEAATRLGVERRRIYDIVNVLESMQILVRKAKNRYTWQGFARLPQALQTMKEAALREYGLDGFRGTAAATEVKEEAGSSDDGSISSKMNKFGPSTSGKPCKSSTNLNKSNQPAPTSEAGDIQCDLESSKHEVVSDLPDQRHKVTNERADCRREKSLGVLSQKFVQLCLVSKTQIVSLDDAAKVLLGDSSEACKLKTKVRRLYDIANILSSLQLIEKTHMTENRKPAFKWLGASSKGQFCTRSVFSNHLASSKVNTAKESRGLKRSSCKVGESAYTLQNASKRPNAKPLQVLPVNIPARESINKPLPMYPTMQPDVFAGCEASVPAAVSSGLSKGLTLGTVGSYREWNDGAANNCHPKVISKQTDTANTVKGSGHCASSSSVSNKAPPFTACSCALGSVDSNFFPVLPGHPGRCFPASWPFPSMRQLDAGFPFLPCDPSLRFDQVSMVCVHRLEGMITAAAMQYQNEAVGQLFNHYVETWRSWYQQAISLSPAPFSQTPTKSCGSMKS